MAVFVRVSGGWRGVGGVFLVVNDSWIHALVLW